MASRPWATPAEVKAYTDIEAVKSRSDDKLRFDIARAEKYVMTYTHNNFSDYVSVPSDVNKAVILLAENYAHSAAVSSRNEKSETFDDYSYTAYSSAEISAGINDLGLDALLDEYVIAQPGSAVTLRIRKL